jgi:thioredoxin-like negative regulator of GroEL
MTVTVFHFWSPTCGPCKVIKPSLEMLKEEFEGQIEWISINTKEDPKAVARLMNISVVPTIVVVKDGMEVGRHSGTQIAIFYTLIRKALAA